MTKHFNDYFSNIGSSLANNIQDTQLPFSAYMSEPVLFSFNITPTTLTEIKSVISNIKIISPGHDEIDMVIIKDCSDIKKNIFSIHYNYIFLRGLLSRSFENSKNCPYIYKKK